MWRKILKIFWFWSDLNNALVSERYFIPAAGCGTHAGCGHHVTHMTGMQSWPRRHAGRRRVDRRGGRHGSVWYAHGGVTRNKQMGPRTRRPAAGLAISNDNPKHTLETYTTLVLVGSLSFALFHSRKVNFDFSRLLCPWYIAIEI